jgi:hypothetical protein
MMSTGLERGRSYVHMTLCGLRILAAYLLPGQAWLLGESSAVLRSQLLTRQTRLVIDEDWATCLCSLVKPAGS